MESGMYHIYFPIVLQIFWEPDHSLLSADDAIQRSATEGSRQALETIEYNYMHGEY